MVNQPKQHEPGAREDAVRPRVNRLQAVTPAPNNGPLPSAAS
jgi:hypothetical protein